jgi:hypothetical protein
MIISACTPEEGETPEVIPTMTQTILPAQTATPSQPNSAVIQRITELEATNGGCEYPCFWGITLGVTHTEEIWNLIEPLSTSFYIFHHPWSEESDGYHFEFTNDIDWEGVSGVRFYLMDDIVERIFISQRNVSYEDILLQLGPPAEVIYRFNSVDDDLNIPLSTFYFLYPSQGILLEVEDLPAATVTFSDDHYIYQVCVQSLEEVDFTLDLYDINRYSMYPDFVSRLLGESSFLQNVSNTMGMTPEQFYDAFIDPQSTLCIAGTNDDVHRYIPVKEPYEWD